MKLKQNQHVKGAGTIVLAAALAIAAVSPGGALGSGENDAGSVPPSSGASFRAFATALMDEVVVPEIAEPIVTAIQANTGTGDSVDIYQAVTTAIAEATNDASPTPAPTPSNATKQAAAQEQQVAQANTQDVINALLGLLDSSQPQVMAAIDAAEAAVLAKVDKARADTVAAFALTELPEEAAILAHIDNARVLVQQAFDLVREQVNQAFADARNTILEELTGVDFGEASDVVLAKVAEVQSFVSEAMAEVQQMLEELGINI